MWLLYPQKPEAVMPLKAGYEEDGFLQALGVTPEELEPLADNCTQVQSYTCRQLYTGTVARWQTTVHRYSRMCISAGAAGKQL